MTHRNQVTIKLGKSLTRLKKDLISSKKILTQYVLPFNAFKLPLDAHLEKNCKPGALHNTQLQPNTFIEETANNAKSNKHAFGRIVDFAKSMVNSKNPFTVKHQQVKSLVSIINEAQVENKYQTSLPKFMNKTTHTPLLCNNFFKHSLNCNLKTPLSARACSTASQSTSCGRHNYHEDVEKAVNQQILAELNACYAYLSMACYFGRTEVALPGSHGFFMHMHEEEHDHALMFINYQNMRGGHVTLYPITAPECQNWESIKKALCVALEMEKLVKEKLVELHKIAEKYGDISVLDLISTTFIPEQERSICEISRLMVRANKMVDCGMSEYLFDKEIHRAFVKNSGKNTKSNIADKEDKSNIYV